MSEVASVQELTPRDRRGRPTRWRLTYADGRTAETDGHVEDPATHALLEWLRAGGEPTPLPPLDVAALAARAVAAEELARLDAFIPRGLEDAWSASGFDIGALPPVQRDRLARKAELRAQIAS